MELCALKINHLPSTYLLFGLALKHTVLHSFNVRREHTTGLSKIYNALYVCCF